MLKGNTIEKHVNDAFNNYVNILIDYLKITDKKDILQEEYKDIIKNNVEEVDTFDINSANNNIMNKPKSSATLEGFVKTLNSCEPQPAPQKKNINLKADNLKTKGIKKKKKI